MKKFIIYTLSFLLLVGLSFVAILYQADGATDDFYLRFTTPPQSNLIIGTSRAAQAIQPKVLQKTIRDRKFYNYAFTVSQSPFGPVYYNSILKKLDTTQKDAIFIISINPWAISSLIATPNDSTQFREAELMLATTSNVNTYPNFEYLYNNLGGKYHKILFPINTKMFLHDDGWLELFLKMDSLSIENRSQRKVKTYRKKMLAKASYSSLRNSYLIKTIQHLKKYGKVFLVRLPVAEPILKIENELMNDFDAKIKEAIILSNGYLDLMKERHNFVYTDGNHLHKKSGEIVSQKIATWIRDTLK